MDWHILNLARRMDRRVLSVANALRIGVPVEKIHFWQAKDNIGFETPAAIVEAIVEDGFSEFAGKKPNAKYPGVICHLWNVCRFLREFRETEDKDQLKMFCHDGIIFAAAGISFTPTYQWLKDIAEELQLLCLERETTFKFLQIGHIDIGQGKTPLIRPDSIIAAGMMSYDNFARIYTPIGADIVLNRILSDPERFMHAGPNGVIKNDWSRFINPEKNWHPEGSFSTTIPIVRDMPNAWLGSDTVDIPMYRDGFDEKFHKDKAIQNL